MDIVWKYKIELHNNAVFDEIENEYGVKVPDELRAFIIANNAATPSKYNFMIGPVEKVLGAVLSYNKTEGEADTVFAALTVVDDRNLIPFAVDPFGNYICYSTVDKMIVFWDHETGKISSTEKGLHDFIASLY